MAILGSVSLLESYSQVSKTTSPQHIHFCSCPRPLPAGQLITESSGRDLVSHPHFLICSWPSRVAGNQQQQDRGLGAMSTGTEAVEAGTGNQLSWTTASKKRGRAERNKERANDRKENWKAPESYLDHLTLDKASPRNPNPVYKH